MSVSALRSPLLKRLVCAPYCPRWRLGLTETELLLFVHDIAAIGFPVIIMLLIPVRIYLIPRLPFTGEELAILDGPTASPFVSPFCLKTVNIAGRWDLCHILFPFSFLFILFVSFLYDRLFTKSGFFIDINTIFRSCHFAPRRALLSHHFMAHLSLLSSFIRPSSLCRFQRWPS